MSNLLPATRQGRVASIATVLFLVIMEAASAQTTSSNYSLEPATDGIVSQVTSVLGDVLPIAGGLLALTIGWKLLKRMTKSA